MQSFTNQKSPYTNSINTINFELRKPIFYNSQKNPNEIPPQPQQPQQNKFRTFKENPNVTEWYYRYGRPGFIRSSILEEDEVLFKEHNENLKQKQRFDFDNLSHETIKIFYQEEEISTNHNNDNITINDSFHKLNIDKQIMNNSQPCITSILTCAANLLVEAI